MAGRADDPAGRSPAVPSRFPAKNQRGSSLVIGFPDRQNSAERSVPIESTIMCREKTCHMQRGRAGAARRGGRRRRASVLYGLGAPQCANGLKCYTTPYKPCEVDRGYTGNCLEDIGVERECTVENATCKTVLKTSQSAYYFVEKLCASTCTPSVSPSYTCMTYGNEFLHFESVNVSTGIRVHEEILCCSTDRCNPFNGPFPSGAQRPRALGGPSAWICLVGILLAVFTHT